MEQFYYCNNYNEGKKVNVVALEFKEYALLWLNQFQDERMRVREDPIDTWEDMKVVMKKRT
ncbi:hypothetical protein Lal_00039877 [Lupinus albus]|nr:hypothetical protein Lal_00039877 [Lupinus albus]